jgi:hypothetical protein
MLPKQQVTSMHYHFHFCSGFKELAKSLKNLINILTTLWESMNFLQETIQILLDYLKKGPHSKGA